MRVTEKEKAEFTAKAAAAGVALSEYLRKAALQIGVVHKYDQAAVHQFRKIGVNLNQIAHHLNAGTRLRVMCWVKLEKKLDTRPGGMSSFCKITIGKTPGATRAMLCTSPAKAHARFGKPTMFRTRNI